MLDYDKLCLKIEKEFNVKIEKNQINSILNFKIDETEKDKYFNKIKKNISSLNNLITVNDYCQKIKDLKELYGKRITILEENLNATILSDYIYYSIIPDLKYHTTLKKFQISDS